ncbi:MAG: phosphotransferase [Pseudomonadales bacterium]|nr:phosphotransferase [Pseudomonadales bacterium]MDP6470776.1 phosphotransferase [Pseudomonadales bacterium]MDP6828272.1 phosphotransferase [Pseudomonadales bacterium]MDP6973016.1 phosphotransferase [Pseudomonadales bacterium]
MQDDLKHWITGQAAKLDRELGAISAMRVEASTRSFYRLVLRPVADPRAPSTLVAMSSPPATERNDQFLASRDVFSNAGLPVPEILAVDRAHGWFLLSDLGERHFEQAYIEGDTNAALEVALQHLIRLQRIDDARIPPYPRERFVDELGIFTDWFVSGLLGTSMPARIRSLFDVLVQNDIDQPQCCIHLDYHCRNLLFASNGTFGIVDFQDAMIGPATYDLASLLYDCYHRFEVTSIRGWCARYLQLTEIDFDLDTFEQVFDLTALQRQLKAIGIFARLHLRDGKDTHLEHIAPVLEVAAATATRYPEATPLADWIPELTVLTRRKLQ